MTDKLIEFAKANDGEVVTLTLDINNVPDEYEGIVFEGVRQKDLDVPKEFEVYEIRHADEDWGEPIELARNIVVNFYGTAIFDSAIPLSDTSDGPRSAGIVDVAYHSEYYDIDNEKDEED